MAMSYLSLEGIYCGKIMLSAHDLLSQFPRGAYTTARTTGNGKSILELSAHISRTASSAVSMHGGVGKECFSPGDMDARMRAGIRSVLLGANTLSEYKITVLFLSSRERVEQAHHLVESKLQSPFLLPPLSAVVETSLLLTHATPLLPRRAAPIRCAVRGVPRRNALVKDSDWVRARESIEAAMAPDEEEALLVDEEEGIVEGTQTNFFAIDGEGHLITAGGGVCLEGTIRGIVLRVAEKLGVTVKIAAPNLSQAPRWRSAFLTSTSRLVLPIDEILYQGKAIVLPSKEDDLLNALSRGVDDWTKRASEEI